MVNLLGQLLKTYTLTQAFTHAQTLTHTHTTWYICK